MKNYLYCFLVLFDSCSRSGSTVKPSRKDIIETVYASGKIISENEYQVYALANGTVREKKVKEGDPVTKDQVLYVISNEAPAARLQAAQSNLENAESNVSGQSAVLNDLKLAMQSAAVKFSNDSLNYFRLKKLIQQNATSQNTVDNAFTAYTISLNQKKSAEEKYSSAQNDLKVALQNAKSQVAGARNDLDNFLIHAQAAGTVYQANKEPGETVRAGEPLALLGETNSRIIRLAVDQQDINKIKTGQEVLLKTDVSGSIIYKAIISRIYPVMNEIDQTFRVDATFKDSTNQPYIHSSVEANIITAQKQNALVIPRAALLAEDSVQIKLNGEIKTVPVKIGIQTLDDAEVLSGLDESSEVILPRQK